MYSSRLPLWAVWRADGWPLMGVDQDCATLALRSVGRGRQLVLRVDGAQQFVREGLPDKVKLRVAVGEGGICTFHFATDAWFEPIAHAFQAQRGTWTGAKVGVYALRRQPQGGAGHADFDYCRFS